MSRSLTISDELYARLESEAHNRGLNTIEELLSRWQGLEAGILQRKEIVEQIDQLRSRLLAEYGEMPDSVELLREDRAR